VISAIGEFVDTEILKKNGINLKGKQIEVNDDTLETNIKNVYIGGDALRGPSTVVESIADGNKVANAIIEKEKIKIKNKSSDAEIIFNNKQRIAEITLKKGILQSCEKQLSNQKEIEREAGRCLECNFICNKCVEVCPNRANIPIKIESNNFKNIFQIIHIDGMCNECGNCETFCPYNSAPYKDKLTLFWEEEDFINSKNSGFILKNYESLKFRIRLDNKIYDIKFNNDGEIISGIPSINEELSNILEIIWIVYKDYKYLIKLN
ncbi:MAG: putative selenate reductase subunit YgfK, partial [Candidatus Cloacimonetes bacterium]|nr:putative selenate reductase subunit YgfK [Candidatus Cloacimonadota bacterium]